MEELLMYMVVVRPILLQQIFTLLINKELYLVQLLKDLLLN